MKLKNKKDKNSLLIQDININKTLKYKIFRYFYSLLQEKKNIACFLNVFYIL